MGIVRENQKRETSSKILEAALVYFATYGFYGAKLDDISKKAGVTNGLIVQRFGSRDNLYIEVFNEVVISRFPSIRTVTSMKEGLMRIIKYVKDLATYKIDYLVFSINAFSIFEYLPPVCKEEFTSLFTGTDFERIYRHELELEGRNPDEAFKNFINYLLGIFGFTYVSCISGSKFVSDDSYLGLFNRWNRRKEPDHIQTAKISDKIDFEHNLHPFEIRVINGEGSLYLPDDIIQLLDVNEFLNPREMFLYFVNNMGKTDSSYFLKSVEVTSEHKNVGLGYIWKSDTFDNLCIGITRSTFDKNKDTTIINCFFADMYHHTNETNRENGDAIYRKKLLETVEILSIQANKEKSKTDKMTLENHGAKVSECFDINEAINILRKGHHFDLIIADDYIYKKAISDFKEFVQVQVDKGFYIPPIAILTEKEIINENIRFLHDSILTEVFGRPLDILEVTKLIVSSLNNYSHMISSKLLSTTKIANTDALTKVKNASAFSAKKRDLNNAIKGKNLDEFALIVCDIDNLKKINDTYGHSVGDTYIKNCSKIICETFAHSPVYRIGGDEFVIILDRVDYSYKDVLIRRFSYKIDQARQIAAVNNGHASISFGVAVFNKNEDKNIDTLFSKADTEMYKHKKKYKDKTAHIK